MSEKTTNERICEAYDKGRKDGMASERESAAYLRGLNKDMATARVKEDFIEVGGALYRKRTKI